MRARHVAIGFCILVFACVGSIPGAGAEEQSTTIAASTTSIIPTGKYVGTAIGDSSKSKPVAVTVYVTQNDEGALEITGVTKRLPVPIPVDSEPPKIVPGGFDIAVSAAMDVPKLSGEGTLRLRKRGDAWVMFASGSGTYKDKTAGGRGFATLTTESATVGQQVLDAFKGFANLGAKKTKTKPVVPEKYEDSEWGRAPQATAATETPAVTPAPSEYPPKARAEAIVFVCILILISIGAIL